MLRTWPKKTGWLYQNPRSSELPERTNKKGSRKDSSSSQLIKGASLPLSGRLLGYLRGKDMRRARLDGAGGVDSGHSDSGGLTLESSCPHFLC